IDLPSGLVMDLGFLGYFPHSSCENWAYWGVAEFFNGSAYLVYVRDSQTIARTRVPDGVTTGLAGFSDLGDMCSFTVSLPRQRWYYHFEGSSQFGGDTDSLGYAAASFDRPPRFNLTIGNQVVNEDSSTATVLFTVTDLETAGSNILVTATPSNPVLLPPG